MNVITHDNVLAERDKNGRPVIDIMWNKDTPHTIDNPNQLTTETLWLATSKNV